MFFFLGLLLLLCVMTGTVSLFFKGLLWLAVLAFLVAAATLVFAGAHYLRHRSSASPAPAPAHRVSDPQR